MQPYTQMLRGLVISYGKKYLRIKLSVKAVMKFEASNPKKNIYIVRIHPQIKLAPTTHKPKLAGELSSWGQLAGHGSI